MHAFCLANMKKKGVNIYLTSDESPQEWSYVVGLISVLLATCRRL